jgi:hypothetical protein
MARNNQNRDLEQTVIEGLRFWLAVAGFVIVSILYILVKILAASLWPQQPVPIQQESLPDQIWKTVISNYLPDALFVSFISAVTIFILSFLILRNFQKLKYQSELRPIYDTLAEALANKILEKTEAAIESDKQILVAGEGATFKLLYKLIQAVPPNTVAVTELPPLVEQKCLNLDDVKKLSDLLTARNSSTTTNPRTKRKS